MPSFFGASPRLLAAALLLAGLSAGPALADSAAADAAAPASQAAADPVVATVNGQPIHLSDVKDAAASMPEAAKAMSPAQLYPLLVERLIDARALVVEAQKQGLEKDPVVQRKIQDARDQVLESAVLRKAVAPEITDKALKARYEKEIANKPAVEEVHARHILVQDKATAEKIIAELDKGASFAELSKKYSKDPGSAKDGGDLGWFKKSEMVPAFADAAFKLKDGQITQTPVHTQFGWHVIKVLGHRKAPPPSFEEAKPELRQKVIQEGVKKAVAQARSQVKVQTFNLNGSVPRATDNAEPPPSSK